MSHIVTIQTRIQDAHALAAACHRLNLAAPVQGTAKLFSGEATGLIVQLPGWQYPAVIETTTGTVRFDNFEGHWGEQKDLDRLLQAYAIERSMLEARRKGYTVQETTLEDGSVRLQILEGA